MKISLNSKRLRIKIPFPSDSEKGLDLFTYKLIIQFTISTRRTWSWWKYLCVDNSFFLCDNQLNANFFGIYLYFVTIDIVELAFFRRPFKWYSIDLKSGNKTIHMINDLNSEKLTTWRRKKKVKGFISVSPLLYRTYSAIEETKTRLNTFEKKKNSFLSNYQHFAAWPD